MSDLSRPWHASYGPGVPAAVEIPDEPGYRDGRIRLQSVGTATSTGWSGLKRARVGETTVAP